MRTKSIAFIKTSEELQSYLVEIFFVKDIKELCASVTKNRFEIYRKSDVVLLSATYSCYAKYPNRWEVKKDSKRIIGGNKTDLPFREYFVEYVEKELPMVLSENIESEYLLFRNLADTLDDTWEYAQTL